MRLMSSNSICTRENIMKQKTLPSYNDVIINAVDDALKLSADNPGTIAGLCHVHGPTGGGKTSALYLSDEAKGYSSNGTVSVLEYLNDIGIPALLVTHRRNILDETAAKIKNQKDSNGRPLKASVIYRIRDNVETTLTKKPLPHENADEVKNLPNPEVAIDTLKNLGFFDNNKEIDKLKWLCRKIQNKSEEIVAYRRIEFKSSVNRTKELEEKLDSYCSSFENILLQGLLKQDEQLAKYEEVRGPDHPLTHDARNKRNAIRKQAWIRRIFPAIAWLDDGQHLLILTIQKLYHSFYDGRHKVRLSSNRLNGNVIFIDEFDYQADVLQNLLAQNQIVREPAECLGQLFDGGKRAIKRLQSTAKGNFKSICDKIETELNNLQKELDEKDINLNRSRALIVAIEDYEAKTAFQRRYLFRTDHLLTTGPLKLRQTDEGFEIVNKPNKGEKYIDFADFISLIEKYIRRFSLTFSNDSHNEVRTKKELDSILHLIFDSVNDYQASQYSEALRDLGLNSLPRTSLPELEYLIYSNLLPNTHANLRGLSTWYLTQAQDQIGTDPLRVEIKRAFLPATPEGLIVSLSSRNLVFGLSATSYIERAIGHFDIRWIEKVLRYLAEVRKRSCDQSFLGNKFVGRPEEWLEKPIPYLQSEANKKLLAEAIKNIVETKSAKRNSTIRVITHDFEKLIQDDFNNSAELTIDFFDTEKKGAFEYRKKRIFKFLQILRLAVEQPEHKGHLIFVQSFEYIKKWLQDDTAKLSRESHHWLEIGTEPLDFIANNSPLKESFISLKVEGKPFILCLLNSDAQKVVDFEKTYQAAFDTGHPVIVLTQIATATNGINLDYSITNKNGQKLQMDLSAIYIIEDKHYYFSSSDTHKVEKAMVHAGDQLRNIDKLLRFGYISRQDQRDAIVNIMSNSDRLTTTNELYKSTSDYIYNLAADVIQEIGRGERSWDPVPFVNIHLCQNLLKKLSVFAASTVWNNNKHLASSLSRELFKQIAEYEPPFDAEESNEMLDTPSQPCLEAVEIIDVNLIQAIRQARNNPDLFKLISDLWREFGDAVMRQEYQWIPDLKKYKGLNHGIFNRLYEWTCFERPNNSIVTGEIWYNPKNWTFFDKRKSHATVKYDPFESYEILKDIDSLNQRFKQKGYKTSFDTLDCPMADKYALHPHVIQRVLKGRFGEECIRVLLQDQHLKVAEETMDYQLFELYDLAVLNTNAFIDAKHWSLITKDWADADYIEYIESGKAPSPSLVQQLINNLKIIRKHRGEDAVLIVANLLNNSDENSLLGFDKAMKAEYELDKASILVLSACVTYNTEQDKYTITDQFISLCELLHKRQGEQQHE